MAYYIQGKMGKVWANTGLYDDTQYSFIDPDYHINIEDYFQHVNIIEKDLAIRDGAIPKPGSDAAAQDALDGPSVEHGQDGGRAQGELFFVRDSSMGKINKDCFPQSSTDMMLVKKEQKDAELDRKIEALRKKNEALMKRYQEVEEDKKRAEQEGMAMQGRKGKVEDLTITINKSPTEKRVVTKKGLGDAIPKGVQNQEDVSNIFSAGRGKRRQILVTAPGNTKASLALGPYKYETYHCRGKGWSVKKWRRAVLLVLQQLNTLLRAEGSLWITLQAERTVQKASENQTPDTNQNVGRTDGSDGRTGQWIDGPLAKNWCQQFCPRVLERSRNESVESSVFIMDLLFYNPYPQQTEALTDLSVPTSSEEQLEYLRWKKEREEIDRERVARHKNSQGQWRRAWDMDKPELTFSEKGTAERGTPSRGGRNARRGQSRPSATESRGGQCDKRGKNVPVVGSKVRGKDRLTGRARRWDAKEEAEYLQVGTDTSLEEFLEELDALCDPEVKSNGPETETQEAESSVSVETATTTGTVSVQTNLESQLIPADTSNKNTSTSRGAEKKVRFSEDLIQGAFEKNSNTDMTEIKASLKSMPLTKMTLGEQDAQQDLSHDQEDMKNNQEQKATGVLLTDPQAKTPGRFDSQETSIKELKPVPESFLKEETENKSEDSSCDSVGSQNGTEATASTEQNLLHTMEPLKNNTSRNTDELIDSSLSVLSLESGDSLPVHSTSTEKKEETGNNKKKLRIAVDRCA
ncbi:hypothetical protein QTP70_024529 [Hemibagrus guttatus]|uniref:Coiled-coil domain-containing protein 9B n=1 Tax=Hemibagrus guttatus TaxID=175788 RepID=A0AAE0R1Q0_9TELE|nr:hypothetical protein QTP70_024529 [Hemibagrus guttatus]